MSREQQQKKTGKTRCPHRGRQTVCRIGGKKYKPDDLCKIEYRIGGYVYGYDYVVIRHSLNYSALCVMHIPRGEDSPVYIRRYRRREWEALLRLLFDRLSVHEWKSEYADNNICDGTQWRLELKFTDGKSREIYGSNEYPALWNQLENRFGRYITEMQTREADPADIMKYYHLYGQEDYYGNEIMEYMLHHICS